MKNYSEHYHLFKGLSGDLDEFVDRVSSLIGCPITLEDANHRLLAYSTHRDITDNARIMTIIGRRVPEKVINRLWKEGVIPALLKQSEPVIVQPLNDVGLGKRVAISIRKNEEVLGFIWALETNEPLTSEKLSLLSLAAKEAKNQFLQVQTRTKRKEESFQDFFWKILTGHISSDKEIASQLENLPLVIPDAFSILTLQFPEEIDNELEKQIYYLIRTTQKVSFLFNTVNDQTLILLAEASHPGYKQAFSDFIESFIAHMRDRFDVKVLAGACGGIKTKLNEVPESYQEALTVIRLKRIFKDALKHVHNYDDLGIYQYLDRLQNTHSSKKKLPDGLSILTEYDQTHKSELYHTLHAYLEHDCNPHAAAKHLHIHANTLTYRLKRITEITGYNLKDTNVKAYLFIEIKLALLNNEKTDL